MRRQPGNLSGLPRSHHRLAHFASLRRPRSVAVTSTASPLLTSLRAQRAPKGRLVICAVVTSGLASCVTQLDNLEGKRAGVIDDGEPDAGRTVATTQDAAVAATDGEPIADAALTTTAGEVFVDARASDASGTGPTPPPCTDGLLNEDGFCVPRARCAPGTFVSEAAGERVCSPCPSGAFSSEYDAVECQTWRNCEVGGYVAQQGTATTDRQCDVCPEGETTTTANAGECTGASDCAAGTLATDGGCVACSAGNYCSGKSDAPAPCETPTWDDDSDPATPCVVRTVCAPGQFVVDDGSALTDRSCDFCAEATFSSEDNATECGAWSTCGAGSYVSLQGTPTTDRACTECAEGTFTSDTNLANCAAWATCSAPLQYATTTPSSQADRECGECINDYTASQDNATECDVAPPPNLVTNYDFESNAAGWESWVGSLSSSSARAYTGTRSLLVTGSGTGPAATTLSGIEAGATYNVSFWVNVGKVSSAQVNITRSLTCNGTTTYEWVANNAAVAGDTWTQLSGTFSIPSSCSAPIVKIYAEGSGANVDLYVDNVRVTKVTE